jgi:hypothetical protein
MKISKNQEMKLLDRSSYIVYSHTTWSFFDDSIRSENQNATRKIFNRGKEFY